MTEQPEWATSHEGTGCIYGPDCESNLTSCCRPNPLEERIHGALRDAGLDEADAVTAFWAVMGALSTRDQWRVVCNHGATAWGSPEQAEGARVYAGEHCADARIETRRVIEFQTLNRWRTVQVPDRALGHCNACGEDYDPLAAHACHQPTADSDPGLLRREAER